VMLNLLGLLAAERGDRIAARAYYDEALTLARATNDLQSAVYLLFCLASLAIDDHDIPRAVPLLHDAIDLAVDTGSRPDLAESLEAVARVAVMSGDARSAAILLGAVEALRDELGIGRSAAESAAHARFTDEVRAAFGDVEYAGALADGRNLPLEDATVIARACLSVQDDTPL